MNLVQPYLTLTLLAATLFASTACAPQRHRPDLLGEHPSIGARSTALLQEPDPEINREHVTGETLDFYKQDLRVERLDDYDLIFYHARHTDAAALRTTLREQVPSSLVDEITVVADTNQLILRVPKGSAEVNGEKPSLQEALMRVLRLVDIQTPQIMIEVDVVRVFADYTQDIRAILQAETTRGETLAPSLGVDLPGAHLRSPQRSDIGGQYGVVTEFGRTVIEAALDTLESHGFAENLARPTLVVSNGRTARIELEERIPIPKDVLQRDVIITTTEFERVPSFLEIRPQMRADQLVKLRVESGVGSVDLSGPIQLPTITQRSTNIEGVYLQQGQTLTVAGFTDRSTLAVERKVPVLGDVPVLGALFRGKDEEQRRSMILFMVRPYYIDVRRINSQMSEEPVERGAAPPGDAPLGPPPGD